MPKLGELKSFRVFPPSYSEEKEVSAGRVIGQKNMEVLLQPTQKGRLKVPAISFSFFSPAKGTYQTLSTRPLSIYVTASDATAAKGGTAQDAGHHVVRTEARPIRHGLQLPRGAWSPYRSSWFWPAVGVSSLLALSLFFIGRIRVDQKRTLIHQQKEHAKKVQIQLSLAIDQNDVASILQIIYDAMADALGDEAKSLPQDALMSWLVNNGIATDDVASIKQFFDDAQSIRYAPLKTEDHPALFDDAKRWLSFFQSITKEPKT